MTRDGGAGSPPGVPEDRRFEALCGLLVFLAVCAAFLPCLWNDFVNWDDKKYLLETYRYRGLGWENIRWMLTTTIGGPYQPLTWLSFAADHALWGLSAFGFHLTNVLLHAVNAVLFYALCLVLLRLGMPDGRGRDAVLAAGFSALLFAVHPLRVESVAWAIERKDVLSGAFYLSALLFYLKARRSTERYRAWLGASVSVYALSLLSKGVGITLPGVLVLLDVFPLRRLTWDLRRWPTRENARLWLEKLPFAALALGTAALGFVGQSTQASVLSMEQHGVPERIAQACFGLGFYIWKTLFPSGLVPLYEIPTPLRPLSFPFVAGAAFTAAAAAFLIAGRGKRPGTLAAGAFYAGTLFPMIGIVQFGPQLAADRYTYLACLSWAALAGGGALALGRRGPGARRAVLLGGACLVWMLAGLTVRQCRVWRDSRTLWGHTLRVRPEHAVARINMGTFARREGRLSDAAEHFREAVRINPRYTLAHTDLGRVLERLGRAEEARKAYAAALRIAPNNAEAHYRLGRMLEAEGKRTEAEAHYKKASAKRVGFRLPVDKVGEPGAELERRVRDRLAAVREDPSSPRAHINLGNVYVRLGRLDEAEAHFREALRLAPDDPIAHFNLGNTLVIGGELSGASHHYREALRLDPGLAAARDNLRKVELSLSR